MTVYARGNPARWWKTRSCGAGSRAPTALFVSPIRRYAGAGTLGFLLVLLGGVGYATNPTRVARLSEVLLSKVLGGTVTVKSARLSLTGTLLLNGVEVRTNDPEPMPGSNIPILSAETIQARFDWASLLTGNLSATQLVAEQAVFRPIEDRETGHWNYERLKPGGATTGPAKRPSSGSGRPQSLPVVVVHDARVEWGETRGGVVQKTGETVIDGRMTPDASEPTLYRFQFMQSAPGDGVMSGETRPADVGVTLSGTWDLARDVFFASTRNVVLTDAVRRGMPRQVREWCDRHQLVGRLAEMNVDFNEREGVRVSVKFDNVSMMWMVEPQPGIGVAEERPSYPLTINDVHGTVLFSMNKGRVDIQDLRGDILGYQFVADCALLGMSPDAAFDLNLRFPNAVLGERYPALFMATLPSQDLIQRVRPHGKADLAVRISRPEPKAELAVNGTIECHDVQMRFAHFPYPLEHMQGKITFDEQSVTLHGVTAESEGSSVKIEGTTGTKWTNTLIDFVVTSDHVMFDDRLGACLPQQFAPIWEQFSFVARGGFECRVKRKQGFQGPPTVTVDARIDDGEGYIKWMPYRFNKAKGMLHFGEGEAKIENFSANAGSDGSGRVTIDGVVHFPSGDITQLSPELRITADVPIEPALVMALPDEVGDPLEKLQLGGRVGFNGIVRREDWEAVATRPALAGKEAKLAVAGSFKWSGGSLVTKVGEWPVAFRDISAEAEVAKGAMEIRSFDGQWISPWGKSGTEQVHLQAAGPVDFGTMAAALKVKGDGKQLTVPGALPVFMPAEWQEGWKAFSPSGKVDLQGAATVKWNSGGVAGFAVDGLELTVQPKGAAVKRNEWPEAIEDLRGTVLLKPGVVEMKSMTAKAGQIDLQWSGDTNLATGGVALSGTLKSDGLPVKWFSYLPAEIANSLEVTKHEGGDTAVTLQVKELVRRKAEAPWSFNAQLDAARLGFKAPLPMQFGKGTLVATGTFSPGVGEKPAALDAEGVVAGMQMVVYDRLIDTVTARINVVAADRSIHVSDIDGRVGEGTIKGRVHVYLESPQATGASASSTKATASRGIAANGGYHAELALKDAELARVFLPPAASEDDRKKLGTGKVAATLTLDETFGVEVNRDGHGEMAITDATIYNVPLSMGLMQVVTLRLPVASSFNGASMTYTVEDNAVRFDKILLESRGINLAGTGTVGIKDKSLDLSFVTESPNEQFVPILSPIIRETRNELMQLSVGGTLENPKIVPVPLSGIGNALKALLPARRVSRVLGKEGTSASQP